jgi:hypothetical protein
MFKAVCARSKVADVRGEAKSEVFDMGIALQQGAPVSPILFVIKMQFAFLNASLGDLKGDFTTIIKRAPSSVFWLSAAATCYLDDVALMAAREKVASDGIDAPLPLGQKVLTQVEKELQVGAQRPIGVHKSPYKSGFKDNWRFASRSQPLGA